MFSTDSIPFGIIMGLAFPIVAYAILLMLNDAIYDWELIPVGNNFFQFSEKLLVTVAVCSNIIPFQYFKRNWTDNSMRGIIFPTLFYVGLWIYTYFGQLGF